MKNEYKADCGKTTEGPQRVFEGTVVERQAQAATPTRINMRAKLFTIGNLTAWISLPMSFWAFA